MGTGFNFSKVIPIPLSTALFWGFWTVAYTQEVISPWALIKCDNQQIH